MLRIPDAAVSGIGLATMGEHVNGLERRPEPGKRVIVIGAGMAGLVAAYELARAGHDPLILEAQNRVGGRVYTLRKFAPGLYAEAGAMRIPRVHDLTLEYCEHFGLELRPFVMGNPKGLVHIGGQRMTAEQAGAHTRTSCGFERRRARARPLRRPSCGTTATRDLRALDRSRPGAPAGTEIVRAVRPVLAARVPRAQGLLRGRHRDVRRPELRRGRHEQRRHRGAPRGPRQGATWTCRRSSAAWTACRTRSTRELPDRIRFGAEVHAIDQDADSVTVHFKTEAGPVLGDAATTRSARSRSRCCARSRS